MLLPHGSKLYVDGFAEDKLPIQKMRFHFMSHKVDPKKLEEAEQEMLPKKMKLCNDGFKNYINEIK